MPIVLVSSHQDEGFYFVQSNFIAFCVSESDQDGSLYTSKLILTAK